jgi:hypothetical protein
MLISCDTCVMQHSHHCKDCVVQAVVEPAQRPGRGGLALVVDADEERALRELANAGLIPEIRMRRRRSSA